MQVLEITGRTATRTDNEGNGYQIPLWQELNEKTIVICSYKETGTGRVFEGISDQYAGEYPALTAVTVDDPVDVL